MKRVGFPLLIVFTVLTLATPALGDCVSGKPASYNDIVAVMFERRGTWLNEPDNPPLRISKYYAFFWNNEPAGTYSQYSNRSDHGTYHIDVTLRDAVNLLKMSNFFLLNPGEHDWTDAHETVVTVRRCGIVTRLMMFSMPDSDSKVKQLFSEFDALVESAKKTKLSDKPQDFQYTLLFEGQ